MDVGRPLIVAVSTNGCERGLGLLDGLHALYFFSHALRVRLSLRDLEISRHGYATDGCEVRTEAFGSPHLSRSIV